MQFRKAPVPIVSTELGITIDVRLEQSSKALFPIDLIEVGITNDLIEEHSAHNASGILVTEVGIFIVSKLEQSENLQVAFYQ